MFYAKFQTLGEVTSDEVRVLKGDLIAQLLELKEKLEKVKNIEKVQKIELIFNGEKGFSFETSSEETKPERKNFFCKGDCNSRQCSDCHGDFSGATEGDR